MAKFGMMFRKRSAQFKYARRATKFQWEAGIAHSHFPCTGNVLKMENKIEYITECGMEFPQRNDTPSCA